MMNLRKSGSKFLMFALTLLVAATVGILIAPMRAEASETVTVGDYTYTITDGTAVLSKYNGTSSSVTVPTSMTYNGMTYKIRTIGASAFEGNTYIKKLVIPEGITSVGNAAFNNCTSLSSITINGDIGDASNAVNLYEFLAVFYNAGANSSSLVVTFGSSVTRVPAYFFGTPSSQTEGKYAHITSIVLSDSITEIGDKAFLNCYDLTSITWGSGVTTIGFGAFSGCCGLTELEFPSSLVTIEGGAFENCTRLKSIKINSDLSDCDFFSPVFLNAGANTDSLTVTFGSAVTRIPKYIFRTTKSKSDGTYAHITSVTINSKATEICDYAFDHCYDLKTVTLNCNGLTIGSNSFGDVTATVYYPTPNSSWTSDLRMNYGGTLTWTAKFMSASKMAFSSVANATNGVKLSWSKVSAATGYKIYRKSGSGSYSLLKTITSNSTVTYTDTTVSSGTSYTYYIQAYNSSITSSYTTKTIMHLGKCSVSYVCNTMDGLKAAWNKVTGASGYYVYRRNDDGTYSTTPTATITSGSTTNWTDTSTLTGGKSYTYKVAAYYKNSSGAVTLGAGATTKTCMYLKGGEVSSVANTSTGLKVTWSKVAGANGYQVYRKVSGGDYSLVKTVSGGSTLNWTDTSAADGKTYTYKVSPIYTNTSGQVTKGGAKTTKTCVRLTAPSISSLTNSASTTMLVKWGKKSGVTGYQIQYSTSSTFASGNKTVTVTGASNVSKTIASLTKNKTYYVRIRTYKTVSGTSYYSVWSAKKSVKITK